MIRYERIQTLAGLVNGIFLLFVAFHILVESLERIYNPPVIHPEKMIGVAIIGLVVNILGVTLFHEHAHFYAGHEHSCGSSHSHDHSHAHTHVHHVNKKVHTQCGSQHSHKVKDKHAECESRKTSLGYSQTLLDSQIDSPIDSASTLATIKEIDQQQFASKTKS